jgi:hypothetical protein
MTLPSLLLAIPARVQPYYTAYSPAPIMNDLRFVIPFVLALLIVSYGLHRTVDFYSKMSWMNTDRWIKYN